MYTANKRVIFAVNQMDTSDLFRNLLLSISRSTLAINLLDEAESRRGLRIKLSPPMNHSYSLTQNI